MSGLTASVPVRRLLSRHRGRAALPLCPLWAPESVQVLLVHVVQRAHCGDGALEGGQLPLPPITRVILEESHLPQSPCASRGQVAPFPLPTFPRVCFSLTYQPTEKTGFLESLTKTHMTVTPATRKTKSFRPWRKRQGNLCRAQVSGFPSPLFSQI